MARKKKRIDARRDHARNVLDNQPSWDDEKGMDDAVRAGPRVRFEHMSWTTNDSANDRYIPSKSPVPHSPHERRPSHENFAKMEAFQADDPYAPPPDEDTTPATIDRLRIAAASPTPGPNNPYAQSPNETISNSSGSSFLIRVASPPPAPPPSRAPPMDAPIQLPSQPSSTPQPQQQPQEQRQSAQWGSLSRSLTRTTPTASSIKTALEGHESPEIRPRGATLTRPPRPPSAVAEEFGATRHSAGGTKVGKLTGVFGITNAMFAGSGEGEVELRPGNTVVALEVYSDGFGYGLNQKTGTMGYFPLSHVTFPTTPDSPDGIMVEVEISEEAAEMLGIE
ncbi:hypothetical protein HK104_002971 [Borealophlyctis nickersoniae]|nr:hypothetical protein HK104_002971 [Borealophlyctis nickersoniae]